jgi:taurine--2-oxoglutarate transaminase
MARQITGRKKILARQKSYHGSSLGALSVTGDWRSLPHFRLDGETVRIPEPEEDPELKRTRQLVHQTGTDQIAAIILETISGTNGVSIPSQDWFDGIQTLCHEHGILLIIDEVLCGFGRTGPTFAYQDYGLRPDLVCMSKGISGGYIPFGAIWTGRQVVQYYNREKMVCGLTSYAHPLGLAALDGVLDIMADEGFQENKSNLERLFGNRMIEIAQFDFVREVRCRGLIAAIDLQDRLAPSWEEFRKAGLHVFSKDHSVILAPPFVSTPARLNAACDVLIKLLQQATATA